MEVLLPFTSIFLFFVSQNSITKYKEGDFSKYKKRIFKTSVILIAHFTFSFVCLFICFCFLWKCIQPIAFWALAYQGVV